MYRKEPNCIQSLCRNPDKILPIFIARAGMDNPQLNESLDKFITEVLANNLYVDVYNHPTGHHAFELFDDNKRTHDIVKKLWISAEQFIIKVHYKITDFTFHYPGETPTTLSPEDLKTIE